MPDYKNGKIYKIISDCTDKVYIGSTIQKLSCRMTSHRKRNGLSSRILIEFGDAKIVLLEAYPCSNRGELTAREQHWINIYKDSCINKYKAHTGLNKNEYQRAWNKTPKGKMHKKKSDRMPVYCVYCDACNPRRHTWVHKQTNKHKNNVEYFDNLIEKLCSK